MSVLKDFVDGANSGSFTLVSGTANKIRSNFDIIFFNTGNSAVTVKVRLRNGSGGTVRDFEEKSVGSKKSFPVTLKQNLATGDQLSADASASVNWAVSYLEDDV